MAAAKRDYKKEYKRDHSSTKAKKDRASRNKAHRNAGHVPKGHDVHHKDGNPRTNKLSNLKVMPRSKNRAIKS